MLSDRAPGFLQPLLSQWGRDLWVRFDGAKRQPGLRRDDLPATDFVLHVAVWAALAMVVALIGWTYWWLILSSAALATGSLALELAQGIYADTRSVELIDGVANLVGVATGSLLAALIIASYRVVARLLAPSRAAEFRR